MSLTRTQQKLVDININWCDLEEDMGENAALEVACNQEGVDSQWFYDNFIDHSDIVNSECQKIWDSRKKKGKK